MVISEQQILESKVTKAQNSLARLKARLLRSKTLKIKTLKVETAYVKQVKSGRAAWTGKATDPKTGILYQISAVAVPVKVENNS